MSKKLTTLEVIEEFKKAHKDKYDYSLVNYKGAKEYNDFINNMAKNIAKELSLEEQEKLAATKNEELIPLFSKTISDTLQKIKLLNEDNIEPELKYYKWGFECPNISKLKTKEEKDIIYNKILNLFEEQLKNWIYEK